MLMNLSESEETFKDSSSKGYLCLEIGNLRFKGPVGRPKKQSRRKKNPFDFANLEFKKGCKKVSCGKNRKGPYRISYGKIIQKMETIIEDLVVTKEEKAK